jgi:WD40 repeat protein
VLDGHEDEIFSCAFNYEGDTIITGSKDNTCRIWKDEKIVRVFFGLGKKSTESLLVRTRSRAAKVKNNKLDRYNIDG